MQPPSLYDDIFIRRQAGWGKNPDYGVPSSAVDPEQLKTRPYFYPFLQTDLMSSDVDVASTRAGEPRVQYDVLARALPALSYAAGANRVPILGDERNFDLEVHGRGHLWPRAGGRWLHRDVRNVALPYLYQTYEEMIRRGAVR